MECSEKVNESDASSDVKKADSKGKMEITTISKFTSHDSLNQKTIKTTDSKGKSLKCTFLFPKIDISEEANPIDYSCNVSTNHSSTGDLLHCIAMQNKHFIYLTLKFLTSMVHIDSYELIKKAYIRYEGFYEC